MRWFYHPKYDYGRGLPMREVHGFVLDKPSRIYRALIELGAAGEDSFELPEAISEPDLVLVHTEAVRRGLHSARSLAAAVEYPPLARLPAFLARHAVLEPQLYAAGGTYQALRVAAQGEWAVNVSGGYHHARPDLSHGFCLVNDIAIASAKLQQEGIEPRILILDLDLHQGDGNAVAFAEAQNVFTVSIHEDSAFPVPKMESDLDIGLPSGTGDVVYLQALEEALVAIRERFSPEIIVYVAGTDPFRRDPLGTFQLSRQGLLTRDKRVALFARELGCALVALPAGGYTEWSPGLSAAGFAAIARYAP